MLQQTLYILVVKGFIALLMQPLCDLLLACMQIMIAVLARDYDWGVDVREPVKKFPFPAPVWGLPMTFDRVTQMSQASS